MRDDALLKMLRWAHLPECENPPQEWSVKRFTHIAKVIAGQSPPSETYNEKGEGFPFLQGNADFTDKHPKPSLWCSAPQKVAQEGDTLISVRAPVGELNRADREYAIGRGLAAVRATESNADFLYHAIQRWRWSLQRVAQGTTFDAVTARHFGQLCVAVPDDPDEQAAIARVLDAVDMAIERTREALNRARELKKAVLQNFFFKALGETAYADRPTKALPLGWELLPTEMLLEADPKNGVSPKASTQPPGIPTFSIAAVRHGKVDLDNIEHLKYAQIPDKVADVYRVCEGDVLIVRGNANPDLVGKAAMIDKYPDGCIYPDITKRVVFRSEGERAVNPVYAVMAWNHSIVHNQVLRRAKTSNGTLKINNRDVKQIVLPVPPPQEQTDIVNLTGAIDRKIDGLARVATAYDQLKRSLMHDLLTGKVRVSNLNLEMVSTS